jgi:hypothetical protein
MIDFDEELLFNYLFKLIKIINFTSFVNLKKFLYIFLNNLKN